MDGKGLFIAKGVERIKINKVKHDFAQSTNWKH